VNRDFFITSILNIIIKRLGLHSVLALMCISLSGVSTDASAQLIEKYQLMHQISTQKLEQSIDDSIEIAYFDQFIDHQDINKGTFKQRYYFDDSFVENQQAPVFLFICGELACDKRYLMGSIRTYAKKHHGLLVALEHRYYGQSLPLPSFSNSDLAYLTTEQALLDIKNFQNFLTNSHHLKGKWILISGSYPGSLAAYYRSKYPNLVVGALASSAPVKAKEEFFELDEKITSKLDILCQEKVRQVIHEVEDSFKNAPEISKIKEMFAATEIVDNDDFLFLLAEIETFAVQFGQKNLLCNALTQSENPMEGYAMITQLVFDMVGITAKNLVPQGALSIDPDDYTKTALGFGIRQWFYQSCTEYGYWQTASLNPEKSSRSTRLNNQYYQNVCRRLFQLNSSKSNADAMNSIYYQPLLNSSTSHILLTNGSDDPWSSLSISRDNDNDYNPNIDLYTIEGSAHCADLQPSLSNDSESLKSARSMFDSMISKWLGEA